MQVKVPLRTFSAGFKESLEVKDQGRSHSQQINNRMQLHLGMGQVLRVGQTPVRKVLAASEHDQQLSALEMVI